MDLHVLSYLIYLPVTVALTIWVGHMLFKNGKIFLFDIFEKNQELAQSVNQLLLVGFYLINIGYAVFTLSNGEFIDSYRVMIETLSKKVGVIILILGAMHFANIFIFYRLRKRHVEEEKIEALYK